MNNRFRFIEINYHQHDEYSSPEDVIKKHRASNLFLNHFSMYANISLVKHLNFQGEMTIGDLKYIFSRRSNSFFQIPKKTHQTVALTKPDIVLVQGFIFPLQVYFLRRKLGKKAKIILQHHGEVPFRRKRPFQRIMSGCVDGWLFSSMEMANEWIEAGIIKDRSQCYMIPPASTGFRSLQKDECRQRTGMSEGPNFLWVGRLNRNKDPFTVLTAFRKYLSQGSPGKLYMIYTEPDLENEIEEMIGESPFLQENVVMMGQIDNAELESWYNAADYFISGSHREGGSYALMEAMACGCVPIVTDIPASMQMIAHGEAGYFYEAGDSEGLYKVLVSLDSNTWKRFSASALEYFNQTMSSMAISNKMLSICHSLLAK